MINVAVPSCAPIVLGHQGSVSFFPDHAVGSGTDSGSTSTAADQLPSQEGSRAHGGLRPQEAHQELSMKRTKWLKPHVIHRKWHQKAVRSQIPLGKL